MTAYRWEGRLTETSPAGQSEEGMHFENAFEGDLVSGDLGAGSVRGVDRFTLRPDGVGVVDVTLTISSEAGTVASDVRGYVLPPDGMPAPTPEAIAAPGFAWPDVDLPIVEYCTYRTDEPALAHLNRVISPGRGTVNMATRRLVLEVG
jgi:hypothetical protein